MHGYADRLGPVVRRCLSLGVVPVFAPPRESGFQAAVESFNGRWQAKVWRRFWFATLQDVVAYTERYVAASHSRLALRIEAAPDRRPFPDRPPAASDEPGATVIYIRRTSESGSIRLLGQSVDIDPSWPHRLVRVEVDFERRTIRCFALRRRDPSDQPLLRELALAGRVGRAR